MENILS